MFSVALNVFIKCLVALGVAGGLMFLVVLAVVMIEEFKKGEQK